MTQGLMLSDEQLRQFTRLLANYSDVCKKVDYPWHENVGPNLGHSTLFRRLAQSQPLYKYPPPRAMSYPWYELLDEGQDNAEVHYYPGGFGWNESPTLNINQTLWHNAEELEPGREYRASWPHYPLVVRATRTGDATFDWIVKIESMDNPVVTAGWMCEKGTTA